MFATGLVFLQFLLCNSFPVRNKVADTGQQAHYQDILPCLKGSSKNTSVNVQCGHCPVGAGMPDSFCLQNQIGVRYLPSVSFHRLLNAVVDTLPLQLTTDLNVHIPLQKVRLMSTLAASKDMSCFSIPLVMRLFAAFKSELAWKKQA